MLRGKPKLSNKISGNIEKALHFVGLTDYEINLYLTLISKGPMDARELSEASGVPYSRIYNVLTQLEKEKKWIIKEEESRPSRYFAKSPDEPLILAKKRFNDTFNEYSDKLIHRLTPIYQGHDPPIKIALYLYRGRNICLKRSISLINKSRMSIYIVSTEFEFLNICYSSLKKARARGVTDIKILIEKDIISDAGFNKFFKQYDEIANIRYRDQIFGTSIIIDEGEDAFVLLSQKLFGRKSYFGIISEHNAFGPGSNYYFNYLYGTASKVKFD
jgi:sugar-specific transcriptional regulator TrmB